MQKKFKWNGKKIISMLLICAVVAAAVFGIYTVTKKNASKSTSTQQQRTAKVTKGDIEVSITGSGTITSANTSDLNSNVSGKIVKAYFKEGDTVKKGELLYEIDDNDAQLSIQKIENSISQARLNASTNEKSYDNLNITAPFSGKVTDIKAEKGENANKGMALLTITETSRLKISVPFSTTYTSNIKVGQQVEIHVQENMDIVNGTVSKIGNYTYTSSNGGVVKDVEITVENPGALTDEMSASVCLKTSDGTELESSVAKFSYANKKTVTCNVSGTFSTVNVEENKYVEKGDVLVKIENEDLQVTSQTNNLKIQDLQNQLAAAKKTLEDYKVYAPFDGTISAVTAKQGDSLERGGELLSIRDFNQMQFTISVDELDISKVAVGQEVSVTVDALTETTSKPLSGKVIYKAMEGASSNGVATYDVKIKINETENLLAGMNANASIILNKSEGTLLVPVEAVSKRGNRAFVWVKGSAQEGTQQGQNNENKSNQRGAVSSADSSTVPSGDRQNSYGNRGNSSSQAGSGRMPTGFTQNREYYANATMKMVEIGLANSTYIEIKSGLSEGDEVILPPLAAASNGEKTQSTGGFSMGGGMTNRMSGGFGGSMPSGGGQNGGMPSGNRNSERQSGSR